MCIRVAPPQDIVAYSATHDAYHVELEDGTHRWYKEALLTPALLGAWNDFWAKKQKVDAAEATLRHQRQETVSEEPCFMLWGSSSVHAIALEKDRYVASDQASSNDPKVFKTYPPRSKRNGHIVAFLASSMQGVAINIREPMIAGGRDIPIRAQEAIDRALEMAFDNLPDVEKPEHKANIGLFDDFGQHKLNFDDTEHNYTSCNAYERLYLSNTPENSQRATSKKLALGTEGNRKRGIRYDDEVEACYPFLGVVLGRRELVGDGTAYLNYAERKAQQMAAARAKMDPWQVHQPAPGFGVQPKHAHAQLLVVYRLVFKSAAARANYHSR